MVLHENKAEIRTEGGATKLCLCVRFIYLFIFYFRLYFLVHYFFPFHDLFCLSRTPYVIDFML